MALLNARSAVANSEEIYELLDSHQPTLFALTETWFSTNVDPAITDLLPANYNILSSCRPDRGGGGVALIYHNTFSFKRTQFFPEPVSFEYLLAVGGAPGGASITSLCIYHPPGENELFLEELQKVLEDLQPRTTHLLLSGDFNIHINDSKDPFARKLLELLDNLELSLPFTEPTHRLGNQLDLICYYKLSPQTHLTCPLPWSDHHLLVLFLSYRCAPRPRLHTPPPHLQARILKRDFSKLNISTFNNFWVPCTNQALSTTTQDAIFFAKLNLACNLYCPLRSIRKRPPSHLKNKWFSDDIRAMRRKGRSLQKQWQKSRSTLALDLYQRFQRAYKLAIKKSKARFIQSLIQHSPNSTRALFSATKALSPPTPPPDLGLISPETFCQQTAVYFTKKVSDLRETIDNLLPLPDLSLLPPELSTAALISDSLIPTTQPLCPTPPSFTCFQPVSEAQVKEVILGLGPASSILDPLPTQVIKSLVDELLTDITNIINSSLQSGDIPDAWKVGVITPLLKKEGAEFTNPKNLRPITQLCLLPRIAETIVTKQLQTHLETHKVLHDQQSGFRAERGTELATLDIREEMLWLADRNHPSLLVLLDLSAAFDTVDHGILLRRLAQVAGVEGVALRWLGSFLTNRFQLVKWQDHLSERSPVPWGVPQGSSLSPLLFNIYLRPLAGVLDSCGLRFQMFADDTQILVDLHESSQDRDKLIPCLTLLQEWMRQNKLCLNTEKTELLVAGPKRQGPKIDIPWPPSWGPAPDPVLQARNLGVEISHNLGGEAHARKIVKNCHHHLNTLARLFPLLDLNQKKILFQAFVGSRIRFGLVHLLGATKKTIFSIQKVQNRAIRLIFRLNHRSPLTSWRQKLGWLTITNLITEKTCHILWKAKHKKGALYQSHWFKAPPPSRQRRSPYNHRSCLPRFKKTRMGGRTLSVAGAKLWNSLPLPLRSLDSWSSFRPALKLHLLSQQLTNDPAAQTRRPPVKSVQIPPSGPTSYPPHPLLTSSKVFGPVNRPSPQGASSLQATLTVPGPNNRLLPSGLQSPPLPARNNKAHIRQAFLSKRLNTSPGGTYKPRSV